MFDYVPNSYCIEKSSYLSEVMEAGRLFGRFFRHCNEHLIMTDELHITIPDFHNLTLRYNQFENALQNGMNDRILAQYDMIAEIQAQQTIVKYYASILPHLPSRIMHHDAKISNALFSTVDQTGLCVVDLDTIMPGTFLSDIGDMFRTMLSPTEENDSDYSTITIKLDLFRTLCQGYLTQTYDLLTEIEKINIIFAGEFTIFMQCLRFMTDYLLGDVYYKVSYPEHNLVRAKNQLTLLKAYIAAKPQLQQIVADIIQSLACS